MPTVSRKPAFVFWRASAFYSNDGTATENPYGDFTYSKCRACKLKILCGAGGWLSDGRQIKIPTYVDSEHACNPSTQEAKYCHESQTSLDHKDPVSKKPELKSKQTESPDCRNVGIHVEFAQTSRSRHNTKVDNRGEEALTETPSSRRPQRHSSQRKPLMGPQSKSPTLKMPPLKSRQEQT